MLAVRLFFGLVWFAMSLPLTNIILYFARTEAIKGLLVCSVAVIIWLSMGYVMLIGDTGERNG